MSTMLEETTHEHEANTPGEGVAARPDAFGDSIATDKTQASANGGGSIGKSALPNRIGGHTVLRELGAGGMGVVYVAYDERLDRRVAIKLLHESMTSEAARTRLRREAQAMARLAHPNVVTVHEVGSYEQGLFVAMEFVEGQNLREWLLTERRGWRDIVAMFRQAGTGLAAAHEAGLVHRDFKPDNVLVGRNGRARVADFGLAHAIDLDNDHVPGRSATSFDARLTQTGALLGSPGYMAPEQFDSTTTDARTDQFAFCVALWEGLYGERPFVGKTLQALSLAVCEGRVQPPSADAGVPAWIHRILLRGLATRPEDRYPSMQALLDALADDPAYRRRKWWVAGGFVVLIGAGAWAMTGNQTPEPPRVCVGMDEKLAGAWDDERRDAVEAAFLATELGYAPDTWMRVSTALDTYASEWVDARTQTCEATIRGEQSERLLDLRMACYDQRLTHLDTLIDALVVADASVVAEAAKAVQALPDLDRCADPAALEAEIPLPEDPAVAERLQALEQRFIEATTLRDLGKVREHAAMIDGLLAEADALGYLPFATRVRFAQGFAQNSLSDLERAEATLELVYQAALRQGMTDEAARAAIELVHATTQQSEFDQARMWVKSAGPLADAAGTTRHRVGYLRTLGMLEDAQGNYESANEHLVAALAVVDAQPQPNLVLRSMLLNMLGSVADKSGRRDEARAYLEQCIASREQLLGPTHPAVAIPMTNLAHMLGESDPDRARALFERALGLIEPAYGPNNAKVAELLINYSSLLSSQAEFDLARTHLERALKIFEAQLGPNHINVGITQANLAMAISQDGAGDQREAKTHYVRALDILERALGPDHPSLANSLMGLGVIDDLLGDHEQARVSFERAIAIHEAAQGPDATEVGHAVGNLAALELGLGNYAEARSLYERTLAIWERQLGPEHELLAHPLTGLGKVALDQRRPADAVALLERALAIRVAHEVTPQLLADTRFALARARWDASGGRDHVEARALAELALADYLRAGENFADEAAEVRAWSSSP